MGPVANQPQYEKVLGYLRSAQDEGATFACGGEAAVEHGGLFVRPTVVTGVTPENTLGGEEVVGPGVGAVPFTGAEEGLKVGNNTPSGPAGAEGTKEAYRGQRGAATLRAGAG